MRSHEVYILSSQNEPNDVIAFIPTLRQAYLIPKNKAADIPAFVESDEETPTQDDVVKGYQFNRTTIVLTLKCNLRCIYCYEGAEVSADHDKIIDWDVMRAGIDHVIQSVEGKTTLDERTCSVNFFGGEPTVAWKMLLRGLSYAKTEGERRHVKLRTALNTNGYFSQTKLGELLPLVDTFTISLDGSRDLHDRLRPTACGNGSFNVVFATAKTIFRTGAERLVLRATVSQEMLVHLPHIASFFSEHFPGSVQAYEPLQVAGRALTTLVPSPTTEGFLARIWEITPTVEAAGGTVKISMIDMSNHGCSFCGVNGRNFIITPDGLVTSCNRKMSSHDPGAKLFFFGSFKRDRAAFQFDCGQFNSLGRFTANSVRECSMCFARYACRGGCVAIKADRHPLFWMAPTSNCTPLKEYVIKMLFRSLRNG
jgi:uncharacterized protein